jgi:hypothetical protein
LLRVLHVESLILDGLLVQLGVVKDNNAHAVLEVLGVLEINESTLPANLVVWVLSSLNKCLFKSMEFFLRLNNASTVFCNLVCSSRGFDLEINFFGFLLF